MNILSKKRFVCGSVVSIALVGCASGGDASSPGDQGGATGTSTGGTTSPTGTGGVPGVSAGGHGGTQTPAMGDPFIPDACGHASMYCAHTTGSGFTDYGAGFGFDLNNDAGTKGIYDVGAFTGVAFWAKGTPFRLKVLTSATVPTA